MAIVRCRLRNSGLSRFGRTPTCKDERTDIRTHDDSICHAGTASRGNKIELAGLRKADC